VDEIVLLDIVMVEMSNHSSADETTGTQDRGTGTPTSTSLQAFERSAGSCQLRGQQQL
jgi:hypothetical protein